MSLREAFADGSELVSRLRELDDAVDYWVDRAVRVNKPLNVRALAKLACDCHPEFNSDRESYFLPNSLDAGLFGTKVSTSDGDELLAIWLSGSTVMDDLIDAAMGTALEKVGPQSKLVRMFEASASPALVALLVAIADIVAQSEQRFDSIPHIYGRAIEAIPRPNLHNDIGALLIERAGVENDRFDENGSFISAADYGESEMLDNWSLAPGPPIPEHRERLLQLACDAFSRAYGYCVAEARRVERPRSNVYYQACCALEGIRVTGQELNLQGMQELVYWDYYMWSDWCGGRDDSWATEFARRFAYSLGVARTKEAALAVQEAQSIVHSPVRAGLADELAAAVTKAMRSAPAELIRDAQVAASKLARETWVELPIEVRDQLTQAEYMESMFWHSSYDWALVALPYFRAIENLLQVFGSSLAKHLGGELANFLNRAKLDGSPQDCAMLGVGQFARLMSKCLNQPEMQSFLERTSLERGDIRDVAGRLYKLSGRYRNLAAHGGDAWGGAKIREVKRAIYDPPPASEKSLLSLLAKLHTNDRRM